MRLGRGLAALVLLAACACSGSSAQEVTVDIRFSRFHPDHFEFEAGTRVTFTVHNNDPIDHEFIIGDEQLQLVHEEGTEAHHGARDGEISIPAGGTRATAYTFGEEEPLIFGCHLPGHYNYGMRGDIEVS
jgi:uncharacterized cupredoxin-like copper-binding protein